MQCFSQEKKDGEESSSASRQGERRFRIGGKKDSATACCEVRIKVEACGICFSDHLIKNGLWPGSAYPRVPGHEVAGVVDEVGAQVTEWKKGDRVGIGWHGGHCFVCESCRRGDFVTCKNEAITGITRDGGYQQFILARHESLALIPKGLDAADAGPLMCAGITTFNALRNSGARPGDVVAVQGSGGLGHLGIQYAANSGYCVVGIGRGQRTQCWRRNWARRCTSTARRRMRFRSCRSWAERK